jgi:glycosyltransferase involved in cell wall biosynthesis
VIHPPVDTAYYSPGAPDDGGYYLAAGALVPYKRTDLVVEAFRGMDQKLLVVGGGPDFDRLASNAPANVEFIGWVDREMLRHYYRGCKALIFAGVEDFGIIPVEAHACGKPVIAYCRGGIRDSVIGPSVENAGQFEEFRSGLFFDRQSVEDIRKAIRVFEGMEFDPAAIRDHAARFSKERFISEIDEFLNEAVGLFREQGKFQLEERLTK